MAEVTYLAVAVTGVAITAGVLQTPAQRAAESMVTREVADALRHVRQIPALRAALAKPFASLAVDLPAAYAAARELHEAKATAVGIALGIGGATRDRFDSAAASMALMHLQSERLLGYDVNVTRAVDAARREFDAAKPEIAAAVEREKRELVRPEAAEMAAATAPALQTPEQRVAASMAAGDIAGAIGHVREMPVLQTALSGYSVFLSMHQAAANVAARTLHQTGLTPAGIALAIGGANRERFEHMAASMALSQLQREGTLGRDVNVPEALRIAQQAFNAAKPAIAAAVAQERPALAHRA